MLGSVIPSSRFLVNRLLRQVDWSRARTIVHTGPGSGPSPATCCGRLGPDGHLVAIDTNRDFVRHLGRTLRDPRLHVEEGSAADAAAVLAERGWAGRLRISGIPYTTMDPPGARRILRTTRAVLRPDGVFLVYQFTRAVLPFAPARSSPTVQADFEPRNIMPARLYYCRRHAERRGAGRQREPRPRARTGSER